MGPDTVKRAHCPPAIGIPACPHTLQEHTGRSVPPAAQQPAVSASQRLRWPSASVAFAARASLLPLFCDASAGSAAAVAALTGLEAGLGALTIGEPGAQLARVASTSRLRLPLIAQRHSFCAAGGPAERATACSFGTATGGASTSSGESSELPTAKGTRMPRA